jgi:hypothetical protein
MIFQGLRSLAVATQLHLGRHSPGSFTIAFWLHRINCCLVQSAFRVCPHSWKMGVATSSRKPTKQSQMVAFPASHGNCSVILLVQRERAATIKSIGSTAWRHQFQG